MKWLMALLVLLSFAFSIYILDFNIPQIPLLHIYDYTFNQTASGQFAKSGFVDIYPGRRYGKTPSIAALFSHSTSTPAHLDLYNLQSGSIYPGESVNITSGGYPVSLEGLKNSNPNNFGLYGTVYMGSNKYPYWGNAFYAGGFNSPTYYGIATQSAQTIYDMDYGHYGPNNISGYMRAESTSNGKTLLRYSSMGYSHSYTFAKDYTSAFTLSRPIVVSANFINTASFPGDEVIVSAFAGMSQDLFLFRVNESDDIRLVSARHNTLAASKYKTFATYALHADLDTDGDEEYVVCGVYSKNEDNYGNYSMFINAYKTNYGALVQLSSYTYNYSNSLYGCVYAASYDFDGDSQKEILTVSELAGTSRIDALVQIFDYDGDELVPKAHGILTPANAASFYVTSAAMEDFDGDGKPELAIAYTHAGFDDVYLRVYDINYLHEQAAPPADDETAELPVDDEPSAQEQPPADNSQPPADEQTTPPPADDAVIPPAEPDEPNPQTDAPSADDGQADDSTQQGIELPYEENPLGDDSAQGMQQSASEPQADAQIPAQPPEDEGQSAAQPPANEGESAPQASDSGSAAPASTDAAKQQVDEMIELLEVKIDIATVQGEDIAQEKLGLETARVLEMQEKYVEAALEAQKATDSIDKKLSGAKAQAPAGMQMDEYMPYLAGGIGIVLAFVAGYLIFGRRHAPSKK
ncbi:hypothetical protein COU37_03760 [Candidatus Micrarchaeota archaeon CG10_big_fil_rev_8_21_14_0_10_45_29]|nr:MAG: hypothetical protein COU37_03760 [Candidatus Micrarchaeota archaeon CG10_big_fil_rev_8_21_14_0_10_45_29]